MPIPDLSEVGLADLISLRGRVAVVTGGGAGIGASIGHRLAEAGAAVAVLDYNTVAAESTATAIAQRYDAQTVSVPVDVKDEQAVTAAAATVMRELGDLHIWVNNAGAYPSASAGQ